MSGLPEPGDVLAGRFEIVEILGQGGFAAVYRARQLDVGRDVALKILHPHIMEGLAHALERFQREVRVASQLRHPNIISLHEFGVDDQGRLFFTMELLDGQPLGALLKNRELGITYRLTPQKAIRIVLQILAALEEAHSKGIVHRDLNTANVFICSYAGNEEFVKVLDFGLAKMVSPESRDLSSTVDLTITGTSIGTPRYMSPEQILNRALDHRSDIYSMGVVLYQMITGVVPFDGENNIEIYNLHLKRRPVPPRRLVRKKPRIPKALQEVVLKALAKTADHRYQSATELRLALEAVELPEPTGDGRVEMGVDRRERTEPSMATCEGEVRAARGMIAVSSSQLGRPPLFSWWTLATVVSLVVLGLGVGAWLARRSYRAMEAAPWAPVLLHGQEVLPPLPEAMGAGGGPFRKAPGTPGAGLAASMLDAGTAPGSPDLAPEEQGGTIARNVDAGTISEGEDGGVKAAAAEPGKVTLKLRSSPPRARVRARRKTLGHTPLEVRWKRSSRKVKLRFELRGHKPVFKWVTPSRDQSIRVRFEKPPPPDRKDRKEEKGKEEPDLEQIIKKL